MALIWAVSSMPHHGIPMTAVPFRDKGVHFIEYLVLAALLARALRLSRGAWGLLRVAATAFALAFVWGYLDELHQAFVPGRDSSLGDVIADFTGSLTGATLYAVTSALRARSEDL
jgi:VanZ family protein